MYKEVLLPSTIQLRCCNWTFVYQVKVKTLFVVDSGEMELELCTSRDGTSSKTALWES